MNTAKRAIVAHPSIARPGCYMTAEERQEYRAIVEQSDLHDSAKRILKWLIGFRSPDMALSIDAIRDRLPKATKRDHEAVTAWRPSGSTAPNAKKAVMGRETVKRVLRLIDDERGLAVLRMVAEERRGTKTPRVYEIDLAPITEVNLMAIAGRAAAHEKEMKTAHLTAHLTAHSDSPLYDSFPESGLSSGPLLLNAPVPSSCIGAAATREVAKQPTAATMMRAPRRSARITHRPAVRAYLNAPAGWMQ
jgi:hypothetical protein